MRSRPGLNILNVHFLRRDLRLARTVEAEAFVRSCVTSVRITDNDGPVQAESCQQAHPEHNSYYICSLSLVGPCSTLIEIKGGPA